MNQGGRGPLHMVHFSSPDTYLRKKRHVTLQRLRFLLNINEEIIKKISTRPEIFSDA